MPVFGRLPSATIRNFDGQSHVALVNEPPVFLDIIEQELTVKQNPLRTDPARIAVLAGREWSTLVTINPTRIPPFVPKSSFGARFRVASGDVSGLYALTFPIYIHCTSLGHVLNS